MSKLDRDHFRRQIAEWLTAKIPGASAVEVDAISTTSNGFSAETLGLDVRVKNAQGAAARRLMVRLERPEHEIFLDTDIGRQAKMMIALGAKGLPTASVLGFEDDPSIVGRRFLVMERMPGRPAPSQPSYNKAGWIRDLAPRDRRTVWRNAIEAIAHVNKLDWRSDFAFLNRPQFGAPGLDQYLGWLRAWRAKAGGGANLYIDEALRRLDAGRPDINAVDVIWGDSNPGNILFGDDLGISALLDFEAAAIGPAEIDLGWWLFMDDLRAADGRLEGFPDRAEMIAIFEGALGRKVREVPYFELLGATRMALVVVHTTDRLIALGDLAETTDARVQNPIAAVLARYLGMKEPTIGEGFMRFVEVMTRR